MPINLGDVFKLDDVAGGALPGDVVWVKFITQHDGKVRPSHAALHDKVFRLDDPNVPIPPLDYGCRCSITYVASPDSAPAVEVLDPAEEAPSTVATAYAEALDEVVPAWRGAVESVARVPPAKRMSALFLALRRLLPDKPASDVRDYVRMSWEATRG